MMKTLHPLVAALEAQARALPEGRALVDDREEVTWSELSATVDGSARMLEKLGLRPGERIGIHGLNSIELAAALLACWRVGLVTLMLSPFSKGPELGQELSECEASAYLADEDLYPVGEAVISQCPNLRLGLLLKRRGTQPEIVQRFSTAASSSWTDSAVPSDLAAVLFSSGTTGIPKGVMHTHASIAAMAQPELVLSPEPRQIVLMVAPLGYITSLFALGQCIFAGHTGVLLRRFKPGDLLDRVEAHVCTVVFALPPSGCQAVLEEQRTRSRDASSVRWWQAGGDAFPTSLLKQWPQHFGRELVEGYALTEFFPAITNREGGNRSGSIGKPWPRVQARLVSEAGHECGVGEIGEIQLRGPNSFVGYWRDPGATRKVLQDGWFRTGDLAARDQDGFFWFRGRQKDIICCDGEKLSPQHVESALLEHPDVVEAAIVGRNHAVRGQVPIGFVRLRPGSTLDATQLLTFIRARVEDCGVPQEIFITESLPRGRTGKVDRHRLRNLLTSAAMRLR
jgi:acyl-CoA synthetase (AMP-forming)/AMP-acid ligase II